jgi:hypothetical protein
VSVHKDTCCYGFITMAYSMLAFQKQPAAMHMSGVAPDLPDMPCCLGQQPYPYCCTITGSMQYWISPHLLCLA